MQQSALDFHFVCTVNQLLLQYKKDQLYQLKKRLTGSHDWGPLRKGNKLGFIGIFLGSPLCNLIPF